MATVHILLTLVGVGVMGVGFMLGRVGDRRRKRHSRLATTLPAGTGRTTERGLVELTGTVVPAPDAPVRTVEPDPDGTFTAPVSGTDGAVLTAWRATRGRGGTGIAGTRRVATGFRSVPFYVDDGTSKVLVDPGNLATRDLEFDSELGALPSTVRTGRATIDLGGFDAEVFVPSQEAAPPELTEWVRDAPHLSAGDGLADRTYEEATLRAGDEVYVLGYARRDTGRAGGSSELLAGGDDDRFPTDDAVVTHPVDGSRMLVSTREKRLLLDESADGHRLYLTGSAVLLLGFVLAVAATMQLVP
ncbi:hypothetical protein [Haloglomus litoreum]|uniref:hypothetical protein n=1 Tax=Haloglomus litoreum TaxID=3034026 RepID=UPI0023E86BB2|nr:hypothetical protein [Haloglomus sp. DT116]